MIAQLSVLLAIVLSVNACYAAAATYAASRYNIPCSLQSGSACILLIAGTSVECVAVMFGATAATEIILILGLGAVVTGAACDAACGYVFDAVTVPCLVLMTLIAALSHALPAVAIGALAGGGLLAVLHAVTGGRGLGLGDVKLACCIGGAIGATKALEALGIAFVLGGGYAAYLLLTKRAHRKDELRFAPYLAAGMGVVVLYGAFV